MPRSRSGRKIPVIWHGAGAYPGVFIINLVIKTGYYRPAILLLAWLLSPATAGGAVDSSQCGDGGASAASAYEQPPGQADLGRE